jgi:teichuronic acid biosynthesis glycosyltransferase TuaG
MTRSVAVIIPCYNCSVTLIRAIDSIINQSVQVNEIVVVDDCSVDFEKVEEICNLYDCVTYIKNKKNLGLSGSRNTGIWSVNSNIISFLDADDQYHKKKIEMQLRYLHKGNVVSTIAKNISKESLANINANIGSNPSVKTLNSPYQNLFFNGLVGASLMAYTSTLKHVNGYDVGLRSVEDFDLWLRLLNSDVKILSIKSPLYLYYDTEGSLSKDSIAIWRNTVVIIKKFISYRHLRLGGVIEQCIWMVLVSKELTKAEASNNKDLKRLLLLDIPRLVSNKGVIMFFKILVKFRLFKIISLLAFKIR